MFSWKSCSFRNTVLSFLLVLGAFVRAESEDVMNQLFYSGFEMMTRLVNDSRKLNGRPKLCTSSKLMNSSLKHSEFQASIQRMTHESPTPLFDRFTGVGFRAQAVAENVAMMSSFSIEAVMRLWIGSPGHFANILGDYSFFGSGVAKGADGRYYWTQHFARPFRNAFEPCLGEGAEQPTRPVTVTTTRPANPVVVVTVTVTAQPRNDDDVIPPNPPSDLPWHWPWRRHPLRHRGS